MSKIPFNLELNLKKSTIYWRAIFFYCGLLLLTSAILKLMEINNPSAHNFDWIFDPAIQPLVASWEIILGISLVLSAQIGKKPPALVWIGTTLHSFPLQSLVDTWALLAKRTVVVLEA